MNLGETTHIHWERSDWERASAHLLYELLVRDAFSPPTRRVGEVPLVVDPNGGWVYRVALRAVEAWGVTDAHEAAQDVVQEYCALFGKDMQANPQRFRERFSNRTCGLRNPYLLQQKEWVLSAALRKVRKHQTGVKPVRAGGRQQLTKPEVPSSGRIGGDAGDREETVLDDAMSRHARRTGKPTGDPARESALVGELLARLNEQGISPASIAVLNEVLGGRTIDEIRQNVPQAGELSELQLAGICFLAAQAFGQVDELRETLLPPAYLEQRTQLWAAHLEGVLPTEVALRPGERDLLTARLAGGSFDQVRDYMSRRANEAPDYCLTNGALRERFRRVFASVYGVAPDKLAKAELAKPPSWPPPAGTAS